MHNKGVVFEKLRKHQEALDFYDRALYLDPKFELAKKSGKIILES
jgi:tetratricopeptide (TPR) repeat protein